MSLLILLSVFLAGYTLNLIYITVFYHRGLAHQALTLRPWLRRWVIVSGNWITGLDPKGWVCLHRIHHAKSDTPEDPHSPVHVGILGIFLAQLRSYEKVLRGLARDDKRYTHYVPDLEFGISWLNRRGLWLAPYLLQLAISIGLGFATHSIAFGAAYYLGIMSHPVQGFIVNAFGHSMGGRNFDTRDNSRNNHVAAWLIWGEGFQNNHHRYPASAKFSYRAHEVDLGWAACLVFDAIGLCEIRREHLIPRPGQVEHAASASAGEFAREITRA